jgi:hypothetical protein
MGYADTQDTVDERVQRDSITRLMISGFFHESSSSGPMIKTDHPVMDFSRRFTNIYEDIRCSSCTTGVNYTSKVNETNLYRWFVQI